MQYTYLIALGEFSDDFGTVGQNYTTVLFIANTIFTTIISFNLFIAIISESFSKINDQDSRAKFREMADLITENEFLISYEAKTNWVKNGQYLLYVHEAGAQDEDEMTAEQRTKNYVHLSSAKVSKKVETAQQQISQALQRWSKAR